MIPPKEHHAAALAEAHDQPQSGHLRVDDVAQYVRVCHIFQRFKVEQARPDGEMDHRVIEEPWLMVSADIMGPYTPSFAQYR